jgi:hypothetical protein
MEQEGVCATSTAISGCYMYLLWILDRSNHIGAELTRADQDVL